MNQSLCYLSGLAASLIISYFSINVFYSIELIYSICLLVFIIFNKNKNSLIKNLFPYLLLILISHINGSYSWIISNFKLSSDFNFWSVNLAWVFSILGGLSLPLILEYLMYNSIVFNRFKKIIGIIASILIFAWLYVKTYSIPLWVTTYLFILFCMIVGFFHAISNRSSQKSKIRDIIIKFIGSYLILCTIKIISSIVIRLASLDYWYDYIIHAHLSIIEVYLILSFITTILIMSFANNKNLIKK